MAEKEPELKSVPSFKKDKLDAKVFTDRSCTDGRYSSVAPFSNISQFLTRQQMITISSVISVTIFYSVGGAPEVAGPGGTSLAFAVIGVVAICVLECISEMIQMFPPPNALIEFVRAFVEPDLAWVVGVASW